MPRPIALAAAALTIALVIAALVPRPKPDAAPGPAPSPPTPLPPGAVECLAEVNKARAARGLPPFERDDGLTAAAKAAAEYRAARLIAGHTDNDFRFLPDGVHADAAGCAAWEPSWGWGACCTYDRYRRAGAAWCLGRDGRRYMHLFVSRQ